MLTSFFWPIRWQRDSAWSWTHGLNQRSRKQTWFASVMLRPVPPLCTVASSTRQVLLVLNLSRSLVRTSLLTSPSYRTQSMPNCEARMPSIRSRLPLKKLRKMALSFLGTVVWNHLIASSIFAEAVKPPLFGSSMWVEISSQYTLCGSFPWIRLFKS
jgi:hypothetical protein